MTRLLMAESPLWAQDRIQFYNSVCERVRRSYANTIEHWGKGYQGNMDWWVSEIGSRNTYTNTLLNECCHAVFIKESLSKESHISEVVVGSQALAHVLKSFCSRNYPHISVRCSKGKVRSAWEVLRFILVNMKATVKLVAQYIASRLVGSSAFTRVTGPLTLIDTFILNDSFSVNGFNDRYFNGFYEHLHPSEKDKVFYMPTLATDIGNIYRTFRHMRKSPVPFFPKEDVLKISDYLYAFSFVWRALRLYPKRIIVEDMDLSPLFRATWGCHLLSAASFEGLLNYRFAFRLKEKNIPIRLVVDWFENQIIDKGANAGFRRAYPDVPLVGYQGFIVPSTYLCMSPTPLEKESEVIPQVVAVCGKGFISERQEFCQDIPMETAPAFRFGDVYAPRVHWPDPDFFTILLSLPLEEGWKTVLRMSLGLAGQSLPPRTRFWIRRHPAGGDIDRWFRQEKEFKPPHFSVMTGDFATHLEMSNVVVSNTSSSCLQALAKGIPLVVASHPGLSLNPIPKEVDHSLWTQCYTSKDLLDALWSCFQETNTTRERRESEAIHVARAFFEPVTKEATRKFLRLDKA